MIKLLLDPKTIQLLQKLNQIGFTNEFLLIFFMGGLILILISLFIDWKNNKIYLVSQILWFITCILYVENWTVIISLIIFLFLPLANLATSIKNKNQTQK